MSLTLDVFDNPSKWVEHIEGTGAVLNRTTDTFQTSVSELGDRAGLITVSPISLIGQDLSVLANCISAKSGILLTHSPDAIVDNYTYFFVRDSKYRQVQAWLGGVLASISDPVPIDQPAELRITIVEDPNYPRGLISFYYEGTLLYQEEIKQWITPTNKYVYLYGSALSVNTVIPGTNTFQSTGYIPPPPPTHVLTVGSLPIEDIPFKIRSVTGEMSYVTPWSCSLEEGVYEIEMPSNVLVGADTYNFSQWENGSTNPIRTVNLISDLAIEAAFQYVQPPPQKAYLDVHAFIDSTEVIADGLIVETSFAFQTPMMIEVAPGSYTVRLTYEKVTKDCSVAVTEGQTIRIDGQMAPPTPKPSQASWIPLAIGTGLILILP